MPPLAVGLVAIAAVLHAAWNVLLKTSGDPLGTAIRLQAIGTVVLVPIALAAWLAGGAPAVDPVGLAIASGSGVLEVAYFVCLAAAYRRGDLSLVYPLARGTAPLLTALIGVGLLGERLGPAATVGVACLLTGILAVARPWQALRAMATNRGAIGFALATGVLVAMYSAVDRIGVRIVEPWLYGAWLAVFTTVLFGLFALISGRLGHPVALWAGWGAGAGAAPRRALGRDAAAGVLSLTAYLLILVAYSLAPLAVVSPLRESAVVLGAAWGSLRLKEAASRADAAVRIGAAAIVVVGAVLIAVDRG